MSDIYHMTAPTQWTDPPRMFSYSTLSSIQECPLRWQLEHSRFGDFKTFPSRPFARTMTGTIIHETLEHLFRALVRAGLPPRSDRRFREVMQEVAPFQLIRDKLAKARDALSQHPRGRGVVIRETDATLYAKVASLFQRQYRPSLSQRDALRCYQAPAAHRDHSPAPSPASSSSAALLQRLNTSGTLTEQYITHPTLPIRGVIDLVRKTQQGVVLADFKTGKRRDSHSKQLTLYSLMWWRSTGSLPAFAEVVYFETTQRVDINEELLEQEEARLRETIHELTQLLQSTPAPARLNPNCSYCSVRHCCEAYWLDNERRRASGEDVNDVQVTVEAVRGEQGFVGLTASGESIAAVYRNGTPMGSEDIEPGQSLRILQGRIRDEALELNSFTEMFFIHHPTTRLKESPTQDTLG